MTKFGWGLWGAGAIARDFARALSGSESAHVVHVGARSASRVAEFSAAFSVRRGSTSLDELLRDETVNALYVATPHTLHEEAALAAIRRKIPVLVEKPLAPSLAGARRVFEAAKNADVLVREGYMYRCHPLLGEVEAILRSGVLGALRHIEADFGFLLDASDDHRLLRPDLAGGAIWDIGGYPVSFAGFVAGASLGKPFATPVRAVYEGTVAPTGVDDSAAATLVYPGEISARVRCSIRENIGTQATIYGEKGLLSLENPWLPGGDRQGTETSYSLSRTGSAKETRRVTAKPIFLLEAEEFEKSLGGTPGASRLMTPEESLAVIAVLSSWRAAVLSAEAD